MKNFLTYLLIETVTLSLYTVLHLRSSFYIFYICKKCRGNIRVGHFTYYLPFLKKQKSSGKGVRCYSEKCNGVNVLTIEILLSTVKLVNDYDTSIY